MNNLEKAKKIAEALNDSIGYFQLQKYALKLFTDKPKTTGKE